MKNHVGEALQKLRCDFGYSMEKLADNLHISTERIENWEDGTTEPDAREWLSLCDLYGYSLEEMFDTVS